MSQTSPVSSVKSMEKIVSLCKRRGFVYPASEIYGGINGFWDYGPLGCLLKNNIRDDWWRNMVLCPPIGPDGSPTQIVGLDSSIIQNPKTWVASGHVGGFSDPMQTCRQCKKLFRADHVPDILLEAEWFKALLELFGENATPNEPIAVPAKAVLEWAQRKGKRLAPGLAVARNPAGVLAWLAEALEGAMMAPTAVAAMLGLEQRGAAMANPCPACGGDLTEPRNFNLMFETYCGAIKDEENKAYLRPETAQGQFLNFKNIVDTTRVKVPFGVAQVGKSFRNEVTPRNFIFRSREFEQMELEWFCPPEESMQWYEFWKAERMRWWKSLGIAEGNLRVREHAPDELAHYSKACVDVEYKYPFTDPKYGELEGVAHRGCYDLTQHQEHSKVKLDYFDQDRNQRYIPHVIEPASGLTRAVLVLLCEAYTEDPSRPAPEYLRFHPRMAPVKAGVFPLVQKDGMPEVAEKLYLELRKKWSVQYDPKQSIGKRYARMDECGTPFCVTVDGETLKDQAVTIRDRDTQAQVRVSLDKVAGYMAERLDA